MDWCHCSWGISVVLFWSLPSIQPEEQEDDSHLPAASQNAPGKKKKNLKKIQQQYDTKPLWKWCCCCFLRVTCRLISCWGSTTLCSLLTWPKPWGEQAGLQTGSDIRSTVAFTEVCFWFPVRGIYCCSTKPWPNTRPSSSAVVSSSSWRSSRSSLTGTFSRKCESNFSAVSSA